MKAAIALPQKEKRNILKSLFYKEKDSMAITEEDRALLVSLQSVKKDLDAVYINFEYATDTDLIDSYIYEVKALQLKYEYIIKEIKQRGIHAQGFEYISS